MILIPTIELSSGAVVDPETRAVLSDDPLQVGRVLRDRGALLTHLRGAMEDIACVGRRFADAGLPCLIEAVDDQCFDPSAVEELFGAGVDGLIVTEPLGGEVGRSRQVFRAESSVPTEIPDGIGRVVLRCAVDQAETIVSAHGVEGPQLFLEVEVGSQEELEALSALQEQGLAGLLLPGAVRRALQAAGLEAQPN